PAAAARHDLSLHDALPISTRDSVVPVDDLPSAGQISSTRYEHAEGLFALYPPEDWTASEDESSASFDAPDSSGYIYIQVTNTAIDRKSTRLNSSHVKISYA